MASVGSLVDVHMLHMPSTNPVWLQLCLESLRDEPIQLHRLEGVEGHIGRGRAKGFMQGNSPYVSYVDPDDLVVPGAFELCVKTLEQHPEACGAYSDEMLIDESGKPLGLGMWSGISWNPLLQLEPRYLHNGAVMRRSFVEKYLLELKRWPNMAEFVLKGLLAGCGPWIHVNQVGYKWRVSAHGAHRKQSMTYVYAARWRIIPTLQQAAKRYGATIPADGVFKHST